MRIIAAGLGLLLVGCAPAPWQWRGTTDFTPEERTQIEEAQDFVCSKLDRTCAPISWSASPGETGDYVITRRERLRSPFTDAYEPLGITILPEGGIQIRVTPFMRRATAHELVHWGGIIGHISPGAGLMQPGADTNDLVWTDADEAECRRVSCRE